jgi:16S rRNA (guanine966-N2)-methyltransferase
VSPARPPGRLRIIAGVLRGRRILVPPGRDVRPTGDRAREALFSILGARVEGARVLDAYAGSGALGFEALSRGADVVVQLERDVRVAAVLARNATALGVESRCRLVLADAIRALRDGRAGGPFDLVLADPPWQAGELPGFLGAVSGHLAAGALVVVERSAREPAAPAPVGQAAGALTLVRSVRYGETALDLWSPPS